MSNIADRIDTLVGVITASARTGSLGLRRRVLVDFQEERDAAYKRRAAKRRSGQPAKDDTRVYDNGQNLQTLGEWVVETFEPLYDKYKKPLDKAYKAGDVDAFEEELDAYKYRLLRDLKVHDKFKVLSKNRKIMRLDVPLRDEMTRIWNTILGVRDGGDRWIKRQRQSPGQRSQSDSASRRMRQRWSE